MDVMGNSRFENSNKEDQDFNFTSIGSTTPCPDLDSLYRNSPHRLYRHVNWIWIIGLFALLGLIGNIISIIVLRSDKTTKKSTFLLRVLAVADSVFLVVDFFGLAFGILCFFTDSYNTMKNWVPYLQPYAWPLSKIAHTVSQWILVVANIERYAAVCRPQSVKKVSKYCRYAVIAVPIVATIYQLPRFFEFERTSVTACGKTIIFVRATKLWLNQYHFIFHFFLGFLLLQVILPTVALLFCNIKTVQAVRRSRESVTSSRRAVTERRLTVMLTTVVLVYFICHLPLVIAMIVGTTMRYNGGNYNVLGRLKEIAYIAITINSAANCYIYCFAGKVFRQQMLSLLQCREIPQTSKQESSQNLKMEQSTLTTK